MGGSSSKPPQSPVVIPTQRSFAPTAPPFNPSYSAYPSVPSPSLYPQVPSVSIPAPAPTPKPVVAANPLPVHDINDYKISNGNGNNGGDRDFSFSTDFRVDKFGLRACAKYISKKGCDSKYCYRFHVCQFWCKGGCKKVNDCPLDHHLDSNHNRQLVQLLSRRRAMPDSEIQEAIKRSFFIKKEVKQLENLSTCICMDFILNQCNKSKCESLHIHSLYSWEVKVSGNWIKFPTKQNEMVEVGFCNPHNESFTLLPHKESGGRSNKTTHQIFETNFMVIDFVNMSLTSDKSFYRVRRLSTPSDAGYFKSVATRWLWFWEDTNGNWVYYNNGIIGNFVKVPFSDHIEIQFLKKEIEFSYKRNRNELDCVMNFETMVQRYQGTLESNRIRRRPLMPPENGNSKGDITIISLWRNVVSNDTPLRKTVLVNSVEYNFVKSMIEATLYVTEVTIQRIENFHLWKAYQLKKSQMLKSNNGIVKSLNEQYLFHGTGKSVIDKICAENFDWRLYGTSVGNVYGKGTYFANSSKVSLPYTDPDNQGYRYMFVAAVLVGTAAVGNSSIIFPPINPRTNTRFDSTVNSITPQIFVKYNLDEYCPLYMVKFRV